MFMLQIPSQQVLVVYDDLDLPIGKVRLRGKGGHGGHNGMRSIVQHLKGSQDFPRLKIGIGRPAGQLPVASFVLQASCSTYVQRANARDLVFMRHHAQHRRHCTWF